MKKKRLVGELRAVFISYFSFFILCAFAVTCSFLLFFQSFELPEELVHAAAPITFGNIMLITAIFVTFDIIRKKITVARPVKKIKNALSRITAGDFSVRLDSAGSQANFAEIMESINRMTEELSGVETLRTNFIANVSHEMKTPLAVMQNYGTLLQTPSLSEEKRLENQQIFPEKKVYDLGGEGD